jgi:hypothetical protein
MNRILLLFLLLFFNTVFSQTILKGRVVSENSNTEGIIIVNLNEFKSTQTEKDGFFRILAKPSDTLLFSGMQIKGIKIALKKADFQEDLFLVKLKQKVNQLDEVVIKDYDEVAMGIIAKPIKVLTPAERRLKTAGDFKPIHLVGILGGSLAFDPILNAISGRTSMLKKELVVEKKEKLQKKLSYLYEDEFYTETLKIPLEYIKGFQIYVLDDEKLVASLKAKNITMTTFLLTSLAKKFNSLIENEEK